MEGFLVTIAVVAMGEMGSGIAQRLVERGARVMTSLEGRSAASAERAKAAGVEAVGYETLLRDADLFLSIVPPASAPATAERFLAEAGQAKRVPVFIDCNAIAPQTLHAIATPFEQQRLRFGDASILGWAPKPDGYSPRIYMAGSVEAEAATLAGLGLETRLISPDLGDASAIKMAYGGITKGIQAIGTSMALGAARAGAADAFVAELRDTQPALYAWFCKMLPSMFAKAYRWDDEMQEIAKFLEPERGAADMLTGAATLFRHVAEHTREGPQSEILSVLNAFIATSG